jgi:hypothetical protein
VVAGRDKSPEEPSEVEVVVERRVVQQQEVGEDAEIRNCVSHFDKDCSSNTSDEGDEGLRPAKRRSLFPIKPGMARTPIRKQTPKPSLRRPSSQSPLATQDEASAAHTRDKHARPLSSTDDGNPCRLCTSRNPSSTATGPMPAAAAEYYEWGLQNGSLKRTTTGDETIFHLQFSLKDRAISPLSCVRRSLWGDNACKVYRLSSAYQPNQDKGTGSAAGVSTVHSRLGTMKT